MENYEKWEDHWEMERFARQVLEDPSVEELYLVESPMPYTLRGNEFYKDYSLLFSFPVFHERSLFASDNLGYLGRLKTGQLYDLGDHFATRISKTFEDVSDKVDLSDVKVFKLK